MAHLLLKHRRHFALASVALAQLLRGARQPAKLSAPAAAPPNKLFKSVG